MINTAHWARPDNHLVWSVIHAAAKLIENRGYDPCGHWDEDNGPLSVNGALTVAADTAAAAADAAAARLNPGDTGPWGAETIREAANDVVGAWLLFTRTVTALDGSIHVATSSFDDSLHRPKITSGQACEMLRAAAGALEAHDGTALA